LSPIYLKGNNGGVFGQGETVVVPDTDIEINQQEAYLRIVEGAQLNEVVNALNALGATPQDLMSILDALRASGSLRAELVVI
jgi:flagellar P-ring protein precursor FlgI